jgi:hypothetical protein
VTEKLIVTLAATLGGGIGWWLGEQVGFMTAFCISTLGTAVGVYGGRWLCREYLP